MIEPIRPKFSLQPWKGELDLLKLFEFIKNPSIVLDAISNGLIELSKLRVEVEMAGAKVNEEIEKANLIMKEAETKLEKAESKNVAHARTIKQFEEISNDAKKGLEEQRVKLSKLEGELNNQSKDLKVYAASIEVKEKYVMGLEKDIKKREEELSLMQKELAALEAHYRHKLEKIKTLVE